MGLPVQLPCGSVLLGGVSTIRSTALRLRFFMAAPPVLAVRCWDGISELRRNSEASAQLLEASEVLTKITVLGRLSVISMRRSAEIMQQRRTAVAAVKNGVAPQRISNISEIKTVGFTRKTYRFCVIAGSCKSGMLILLENACIQPRMFVSQIKAFQFVSLRGAQRGRGNL